MNVLSFVQVTTYGAVKNIKTVEVFISLIENCLKIATKKEQNTLRDVFRGCKDVQAFKLNAFLQSELEHLYEMVQKLSLEEFKAIPIITNIETLEVPAQNEPKRKLSKQQSHHQKSSKRTKIEGKAPEEKVMEVVKKLGGSVHNGGELIIKLEALKPSNDGNLRWQFKCGVNECEKLSSISFETKNNRVRSQNYKYHLKSSHSSDSNDSIIQEDIEMTNEVFIII